MGQNQKMGQGSYRNLTVVFTLFRYEISSFSSNKTQQFYRSVVYTQDSRPL